MPRPVLEAAFTPGPLRAMLWRGLALGCLASCGSSGGDTILTPPLASERVETDSSSPNESALGRGDSLAFGTEAPFAALECGPLTVTPSGSDRLGRRPYLQNVSATEALVLFTTREPGDTPELTLMGASSIRTIPTEPDPADSSGQQRFARLSALEPDTAYCYQLADWTEPVGFRTAPRADAPVHFVAFGDSGGDNRDAVWGELLRYPFDLLLHMGDIVYPSGTLDDLETKFFDTYAGVLASVPVFPAVGNHEYMVDDAAPYRQVFALPSNGGPAGIERWYSYDWGPVHFVSLDTERVGAEQAEWLDRDLEQNTLPWTIVYLHRPPFSSGTHRGAANVVVTFSPLFEKHGVPLVLAGHDHDYERTRPINGVTYVVTGGGGYSVRPVGTSSFTAYSKSVFHFVRVEVDERELVLSAIDTDGTAFDSITIQKPLPAVP